ncbi:hypothetical protein DV711_19150 [Motiliproteus coralliicola]|uniref:Uncharacterized protein n=1 Tax=Motiliproteus coralliicola TaxID=2283196 RepID=A0A369W8H5_9GAMM|nr:hypothetical protein DV711_19150 [Motiliproteus coralliicola]
MGIELTQLMSIALDRNDIVRIALNQLDQVLEKYLVNQRTLMGKFIDNPAFQLQCFALTTDVEHQ